MKLLDSKLKLKTTKELARSVANDLNKPDPDEAKALEILEGGNNNSDPSDDTGNK